MQDKIISLLKKHIKLNEIQLEIPPSPDLGDYAFPCFQLAKKKKKSPNDIAEHLASSLPLPKGIKKIISIGPYLNFYLDKQLLASNLLKIILKEKDNYGSSNLGKKEKILVEFISPNTNKSLHLGHLRNGLLGESLSNILESQDYKVIKTCLNNDKGTGMSEAMIGYNLFHKGKSPKIKPDHFVAQCYVDYKKIETEATKKQVQQMTLDWENNNKSTIALWKKITKWVYKGYKETYKNLEIEFDKEYYESKIYKEGKDIVSKGLKKGVFKKKEGAIIAPLEKYNLPDKVLIKSDGTSLYMTQDLYLAELKNKDFNPSRSIYVVASEQDNHFRQLFKILELLKFKAAKKSYHLSYGLISLPSGRMKSREGTIVDADNLMEEVVNLASKEVKKRHGRISKKELEKRAEIIGLGALKFFILKYDSKTSFVYDQDKALQFEGDTGPYIQYTHARLSSVIGKKLKSSTFDADKLDTEEEQNLISKIAQFPDLVIKSAEEYKPSLIANYLLELSRLTNEFYHKHQILKAELNTKKARLVLAKSIAQVIKNGLNLLGISAPESM